jgi:hypothetical protein
MPFDIGKFLGRYLQALACLSIGSMVVSAVLFDSLNVDFSVILVFWAAAYLIRHQPAARNWTIGFCSLILMTSIGLSVYAVIAGTDQITFRMGGIKFEHPAPLTISVISGITAVMVGLPLALLLTPQARREFQRSAVAGPTT